MRAECFKCERLVWYDPEEKLYRCSCETAFTKGLVEITGSVQKAADLTAVMSLGMPQETFRSKKTGEFFS